MPTLTRELVEEVCRQFNQEGMTVDVIDFDDQLGKVELELGFSDEIACVDCVMPTDYLERLIASSILKRSERSLEVNLRDPRNADDVAQLPVVDQSELVPRSVVVLDPTAAGAVGNTDPGPDAGNLRGKTVLFRTDVLWKSWDWVVDEWTKLLEERGATVHSFSRTQGIYGDEGARVQAGYEALISSADLLISGLGNCGSCTAWTIRDALSGLNSGLPTVAVATEHFVPLAKIMAEDGFRPGLRIFTLPYPFNSLPEDEVRKHAKNTFTEILETAGATL